MFRIVGIGGGTGLPVLVRGLTALAEGPDYGFPQQGASVSAIVAVSDNGGSSGLLRQALGIPAVGDLRNCLVAMSADHSLLSELFQFRFSAGDGLEGHALGNLIVAALSELSGNLEQATGLAGLLLRLKGRVLPVTPVPVTLCARFGDGTVTRGESQISARRRTIRKVWLEPENPSPTAGVLHAIARADAIVLGPGSLYTSIIPNLLVAGVAAAVRNSAALKIFACNLMTQPGETDGLTASGHLRVLESYLGERSVDVCLANSRLVSWALEKYLGSGSEPVRYDPKEIASLGVQPVCADLFSDQKSKIAHDPIKLARHVMSLTGDAVHVERRPIAVMAGPSRLRPARLENLAA